MQEACDWIPFEEVLDAEVVGTPPCERPVGLQALSTRSCREAPWTRSFFFWNDDHSLMYEVAYQQVQEIFVGRHAELRRLRVLWAKTREEGEHLVNVLLNTPGIGKTTLLQHFGRSVEANREGLFLDFQCKREYETPGRLNLDLVDAVDDLLFRKRMLLETIFKAKHAPVDHGRLERKLTRISQTIAQFGPSQLPGINDLTEIFVELARLVPIFFAADEIQELQACTFSKAQEGESDNGLHHFTRLLKNLLRTHILVFLSGTRFHILSQIGYKIGSPIREKVDPFVIEKFNREDIETFVTRVREVVNLPGVESKMDKQRAVLFEHLTTFLRAFSGGHPRTMVRVSQLFLKNLGTLEGDPRFREYAAFLDHLLPQAEEAFRQTLMAASQQEAIGELAASTQFGVVREWILHGGMKGLELGPRPSATDTRTDEELQRIVYTLMNVGVLLQNVNLHYYLTSRFHFLEFLRPFTRFPEDFLKQVL